MLEAKTHISGGGRVRGDPHDVRPRMLLRGRLTIAAGVLLVLFFVGHALFAGESGEAAARSDTPPLAGVSAFPHGDAEAEPSDTPDSDADPVEPSFPEPEPPTVREAAPEPAPIENGDGKSAPAAILARVPIPPPPGSGNVPRLVASGASAQVTRGPRIVETVAVPANSGFAGPLKVEYTLDAGLTDAIYEIFARGRVQLGVAVCLAPASGDVLAYAGTDARRLPPNELYPAASLVKVVTAAAALQSVPGVASRSCHFVGSPYRLTPSRLTPPRRGTEISL